LSFERKAQEILEQLELDPKKALKIVNKEVEQKGKKGQPVDMLMLRIIRALVYEKNMRAEEASDEMFGVLTEIQTGKIANLILLETLSRTVNRMA
jgi:Zn-dependent metalloprotease